MFCDKSFEFGGVRILNLGDQFSVSNQYKERAATFLGEFFAAAENVVELHFAHVQREDGKPFGAVFDLVFLGIFSEDRGQRLAMSRPRQMQVKNT